MPIVNLFSKRQKEEEKAGKLDVYQYDILSEKFRVQVIRILTDVTGYSGSFDPTYWNHMAVWVHAASTFTREHGLYEYSILGSDATPQQRCEHIILTYSTAEALDVIELLFRGVEDKFSNYTSKQMSDYGMTISVEEAIEELNHRFKEHSIGYQYASGKIIKMTSEYLHVSAVQPAILLLQDENFDGALIEFLKAHEHYRSNDYSSAINEALKSFESTMKTICDKKGWAYDPKDTASKLLDILMNKSLFPKYLMDYFTGLRNILQSGLPTMRNKNTGHGAGATPIVIPEHYAEYALHLAATSILFLVKAYKVKP